MSKKIILNTTVIDNKLKCVVEVNDSFYYWKKATLKLVSKVDVIDSRPINWSKTIYSKKFTIDSFIDDIFNIDLKKYKNYTYKWKKININLVVELIVDDAIIFDTKLTEKIQKEIWNKPKVSTSAKFMISPMDLFNMIDNLKAIPNTAKVIVMWLSIVWVFVIIINMLVWFHDQFTVESQTYFYSHYDSDWESNSPLFNALAWSWTIWAWIWFMIKTQLKKYMTFFFTKTKFLWNIDRIFKVSDIIWWKSRVDLKDISLRIVACNMELWQYKRWSWTNTRTVSFSEPTRAVSLYDSKIDFIPKNTDIGEYIKWEFSFEKMYKVLYPEQIISNTHWLKVHWEVQLLHDKFIDQELIGDSSFFRYKNFLQW